MYRYLAEQEKRYKEKKEFKNNLHFSTEYMDWLENFTNDHNVFSTDSFIYEPDSISEEDQLNVCFLEALFEEINDYSDENFINPYNTNYGQYYSIKHNGIGYDIEVDFGQGTCFYCNRLEEPRNNSLDYKHIMSSVKLPSTIRAEYKLEELTKYIEKLIEEDVPVEAIQRTTEDAIQKVKVKN